MREIEALAISPGKWQVRIPAQATVQGEPGTDLPRVLRICTDVIAAESDCLDALLHERIHVAQHEIAQAQAGVRGIEGKYAVGGRPTGHAQLGIDVVHSKSNLVGAF